MTIRFLDVKQDAARLLEIAHAAFPDDNRMFLTEQQLHEIFTDPLVSGIALIGPRSRILGYMLYRVTTDDVSVLEIAVHPEHQRQKFGTLLLFWLIERNKGRTLKTLAPDTATPAHLFLKANGLKAVRIVPDDAGDHYEFTLPNTLECPF